MFIAIELTDLFCIYYKFKGFNEHFNDVSHITSNRDSQSNVL
jgi:hypothetical protein